MHTLAIHKHHVRCVAYSPDGTLLATASNDRSVRLIETATGKNVRSWQDLGGVMQTVAFSPDGKRLAFGGQISHIFTGEWGNRDRMGIVPLPMAGSAHVTSLVYTMDGKRILCGTGDRILRVAGHLHVLDADPPRVRLSRPERFGVQNIAFRRDGREAVIGSGSGWGFASPPNWVRGYSWGRSVPAVAISPEGATVAVADGFSIFIPRRGSQGPGLLRGHRGKVMSLAFTPDGRKLISGSWDRTVRIWDIASAREESALAWERGKVQYVAVAPDGMTAAAACDKGVVIWDLDF
jgi:WD40 repeat protein